MHKIILNVALWVAAVGSAEAVDCDPALLAANQNVTQGAANYAQPNYRGVGDQSLLFGKPFDRYVNQLQRGSLLIDSGAGYGFAALWRVMYSGMRAVAIDVQNYWALPAQSFNSAVRSQIGHVFSENGFSFPSTLPPGFIENHAQRITRGELPGFTFKVGFSETVLPTLAMKAHLLTDLWGAYFYSAQRALLLESYLNALQPTGKAFVLIGHVDRYPKHIDSIVPRDWVIDAQGKRHELVDFLVQTYPKSFKLYFRSFEGGDAEDTPVPSRLAFVKLLAERPHPRTLSYALVLEITRVDTADANIQLPLQVESKEVVAKQVGHSKRPVTYPEGMIYRTP